jgi:hypothetical protein
MRPWWEVFEGRLESELRDFGSYALEHDLVSGPDQGEIHVRGRFASRRGEVEVLVVYPDSFPFLRPLVFAPELRLGNHQNPFGKNLCLLDRDTRQWHPKTDSAASHIRDQLDKLFVAVEGNAEERARVETPQAEPVSAFIRNEPGAVVFVPEQALSLDPGERRGELRLTLESANALGAPLRGTLTKVATRPAKGPKRTLARAGELARVGRGPELVGRWLRVELPLDEAPAEATAQWFLEVARQVDNEWWAPQYQGATGGEIAVLGLVYAEEVEGREREDTWLFVVRVRTQRPPKGRVDEQAYLVKGQRLTRADIGARIPTLAKLAEKTVAVIGLGALGAPLALELARAQVGALRLLDWDDVEAGNSVRWPLGLAAAGRPKTDALGDFAAAHYPLTDLHVTTHQLGMPGEPGRERRILTDIVAAADLIIGVTAEYGIDHLLTYLGAEAGKPQLYTWGTPGYWGGGAARVIPGETGCWYCLKLWHQGGEIPPPPYDPAEPVQPRGCASPTATGASFDLLPVVAQAARLAVQTLLRGEAEAYPDVDADVMIMSLRTQDGPLAAPNWATYALGRHPDCPYCRA